jgi:hypothetical protein
LKKSLLFLILSYGLCLLNGCGTSTPPPPPPAATHFSVTPATSTPTAGTAFSITVSALDASNSVVTSYSRTVRLSSSDSQAVLPASSGLTNGNGTFSVTLKTAAGQTITATDTASLTGTSNSINVAAGPATHLTVSAPSAASAAVPFNVTVTAYDAYKNVAAGYAGMVHFASTDSQAALPPNSVLAGGMGTFPVILRTITNTTITATDTATASLSGSSTPIAVFSNAATHLLIATLGNATTRTPISVQVKALDGADNISVSYSGTVHFTSTDTKAILPADATLPNGFGNFSATFETAGNQMITASDTVTPSLTQTSSSIGVSAAATLAITSGVPPGGTFGAGYGPITTEYLRCILLYRSISCTPCTGSSGCTALPPCSRGRVFPCVETRQLFLGFPLTAIGGVPPYKWNATGLPLGLGLSTNSGNGYISGTPASPGSYTVVVTVGDSGTPQVTTPPNSYTIVINDPPAPAINATPAPRSGAVNLPYSYTFTASSPASPLTWRITVGTLPAGLTLNPDGVLTGTPTAIGTSSITLIATDEFKQDSAPQVFNIQIFAHGFAPTGSLVTERLIHTATLLNNGKVLIAGGEKELGVPLATAELYDPTTGSFASTGSMGTVRDCHTATLLSNGKVLVTGGHSGTTDFATAELFDPAAGGFAPTGSMGTARDCHTATLLSNGKVLITGGIDSGIPLATAELYDPVSGRFSPTGSMGSARLNHTATLLSNGKVLVTGGNSATGALATAELFDPATGSFSLTGMMGTARYYHTTTLLNTGKVLVTGGTSVSGAVAGAELFDPAAGSFSPTGTMATARVAHTATLLKDGTVLVAGGQDSTAELFDPTAGSFTETGSLGTTRELHTATLLNDGRVLVAGGRTGGAGALANAELYQ